MAVKVLVHINIIAHMLFWSSVDVLASRSLRTEVGGLGGGRGLVVLVALLDEEGDAALEAGDDADGLVGDLALVLRFN